MYQLYFGNTLFPVPPEEVNLKIANKNATLSLVNEGELTVLKSPGLTEYSFTLLLPARRYPFAEYAGNKFKAPTEYLSVLERLKTSKTVFDLSILRSTKENKQNTCTKVTIEAYSVKEAAENAGDLSVDITLLQYVHYGTKVVKIKDNAASGGGASRPGQPTTGGKKYTVKAVDTLPSIAQKFYGTQNRYWEIYKANKKLLDDIAVKRGFPAESGHWWIFPGTVITIP